MKYRIPIQEKISVWQDIDVIIDTEDTAEQIYKHLQEGDFMLSYEIEDYTNVDMLFETEETLDYDYENTHISEIEELQ